MSNHSITTLCHWKLYVQICIQHLLIISLTYKLLNSNPLSLVFGTTFFLITLHFSHNHWLLSISICFCSSLRFVFMLTCIVAIQLTRPYLNSLTSRPLTHHFNFNQLFSQLIFNPMQSHPRQYFLASHNSVNFLSIPNLSYSCQTCSNVLFMWRLLNPNTNVHNSTQQENSSVKRRRLRYNSY